MKDEFRMAHKAATVGRAGLRHSCFVIDSSFVIRASSFSSLIPNPYSKEHP
jgi:hypothetical protein